MSQDSTLVVQQAVEKMLSTEKPWPAPQQLYVSSAANCPRKMIYRLTGEDSGQFPINVKTKMEMGNSLEYLVLRALQVKYRGRVNSQWSIKTDYWSGKIDALILSDMSNPIIVEIKSASPKWFNYKDSLPRISHAAQVLMYKALYFEETGIMPRAILYYQAWGEYLEVEVVDQGEYFSYEGLFNGEPYSGETEFNLTKTRQHMEDCFDAVGEALPDILPSHKRDGECTFRGEPSCPFYTKCFGDDGWGDWK